MIVKSTVPGSVPSHPCQFWAVVVVVELVLVEVVVVEVVEVVVVVVVVGSRVVVVVVVVVGAIVVVVVVVVVVGPQGSHGPDREQGSTQHSPDGSGWIIKATIRISRRRSRRPRIRPRKSGRPFLQRRMLVARSTEGPRLRK